MPPRRRFLLSGALALLAGCGTPPSPTVATSTAQAAATISEAVLPPADMAKVRSTCTAAAPLLGMAVAPVMPATVSGTAVDAQAYCAQLAAAPTGQVPATTDGNTPSWLPGVISGVQIAAEVAGVILPRL